MKPIDPAGYSPTAWAYIGDAYYELAMRLLTLQGGPKKMSQVHEETAHYVRASFQAKGEQALEGLLTAEERDIFRRGRNQKAGQVPKSASVTEYRRSTGLEALIGYLYLSGRESRALEIIQVMRALKESELGESNSARTYPLP